MERLPSPPTPTFWNLLQWIIRPMEYLRSCSQQYGERFAVDVGAGNPLIFLSHPQAIEQILTAPANSFDSGRSNWVLRATLGDHSLLLLDGEPHQRQRQLLMPPFHGERMRAYGQLICQITEQVTSQWQVGQPFVARSAMQEISLSVMMRAVFGLSQGDRSDRLKAMLNDLLKLTASRFGFAMAFFPILQKDWGVWSPGGQFNRRKQQIDDLLYTEIRERRAHFDPTRTDILSLLLAARDEAGQGMTDEELRDELITLLIAGHETTATALSWALYWIHAVPGVKAKMLAEIEQLGRHPEQMAIARAPYLSAVCSETLRIYPVTLITEIRIAKAPIQIREDVFETDSLLAPCIYLLHQREDIYPEPDQFRPERFLERQYSAYEYLPFGGSNRRCIGAAFALFEMKLALFTILSHYQLDLAETAPVVPVRRGVTVGPKGGVKMVMTGRVAEPQAAIPTLV
ncbi:MAG TPA: cytochrome P450 [Coleofasciculaceae cyanobacterium]